MGSGTAFVGLGCGVVVEVDSGVSVAVVAWVCVGWRVGVGVVIGDGVVVAVAVGRGVSVALKGCVGLGSLPVHAAMRSVTDAARMRAT